MDIRIYQLFEKYVLQDQKLFNSHHLGPYWQHKIYRWLLA